VKEIEHCFWRENPVSGRPLPSQKRQRAYDQCPVIRSVVEPQHVFYFIPKLLLRAIDASYVDCLLILEITREDKTTSGLQSRESLPSWKGEDRKKGKKKI
jgi:hypothetical protein